jgi:hypothetical protein
MEKQMPGIHNILEARHDVHGEFSDNSRIAQAIKDVMHQSPNWRGLDASKKEALEMIASKIARALSGDSSHLDHWIDIAGYAQLVHDRIPKSPSVAIDAAGGVPLSAQPQEQPEPNGILQVEGMLRKIPLDF